MFDIIEATVQPRNSLKFTKDIDSVFAVYIDHIYNIFS